MNTKILDFLNGDGSLDIERINQLPFEEYMNVLGKFTTEQTEEYISKMPKIESKLHGILWAYPFLKNLTDNSEEKKVINVTFFTLNTT